MATNETSEPERPLERAARLEGEHASSPEGALEREADTVIGDIDAHVALTDPDSLLEAEAALEAWQIPTPPLDNVPGDMPTEQDFNSEPLVAVFAAHSESEANIVRGLLESEGIAVMVQEVATPAYGSIFSVSEARWADLLVTSAEAAQALAVIDAAQQNNA